MNVEVFPYIEKNIGSYIELEKKLTCINNVQNKDNYCFIYCYCLGLYYDLLEKKLIEKKEKLHRDSNYKFTIKDNKLTIKSVFKYEINKEFNIKDIEFPVTLKQIDKLEKVFDCTFNIYTI